MLMLFREANMTMRGKRKMGMRKRRMVVMMEVVMTDDDEEEEEEEEDCDGILLIVRVRS